MADYRQAYIDVLKEREALHMQSCKKPENQPELTPHMFQILFDWLIEISPWAVNVDTQSELAFNNQSLAMSILLQYLAVETVPMNKLQLVGVLSLTISGKILLYKPLKTEDITYITNYTYSLEEVKTREEDMVLKVKHLLSPSPMDFLHCVVDVDSFPESDKNIIIFILTAQLLYLFSYITLTPSLQALTAYYILTKYRGTEFLPFSLLGHTMKVIKCNVKKMLKNVKTVHSQKLFECFAPADRETLSSDIDQILNM